MWDHRVGSRFFLYSVEERRLFAHQISKKAMSSIQLGEGGRGGNKLARGEEKEEKGGGRGLDERSDVIRKGKRRT